MTSGSNQRSIRRRWVPVAATVLALGMAGCGATHVKVDGAGTVRTSSTPSTPSTASTPTTPAAPTSSTPDTSGGDPYNRPEVATAKQIPGLTYRPEPEHNHRSTPVTYDSSPPIGGDHSQVWADCTGTVYPNAIANENAVHMLEHGAVWITYRPGLAADQVAILSTLVTGVDRLALSPYPDLTSSVSLQAWGYQLFVDNAGDPRIQQFIAALRFNSQATPENGATCADPAFKAHPSTFGHPIFHL